MPAPLDPQCLFEALETGGVDYVLIGGLAAVLHGSTAMTNDADIVPSNDPHNVERLSGVLRDLEARLRVDGAPDGVDFEPHPSLISSMGWLNLTTRCGDLDLTFAPSGLDGYAAIRSRSVPFEGGGMQIHVAALSDIIRSKEAADRPKDRATVPILWALHEEIDGYEG